MKPLPQSARHRPAHAGPYAAAVRKARRRERRSGRRLAGSQGEESVLIRPGGVPPIACLSWSVYNSVHSRRARLYSGKNPRKATMIPAEAPAADQLETFANQYAGRDYSIEIVC